MLLVLGVCVGHPGILIIFSPPCFLFQSHQQTGSTVFGSSLSLFFSEGSVCKFGFVWVLFVFLTSVIFKQCVLASVCIIYRKLHVTGVEVEVHVTAEKAGPS